MENLTLEQFKKLPDGEVFASGCLPNSPEGLNMVNGHQGEILRWVAKKDWGYDWAIYCHWDFHDEEWIRDHGDKVTMKSNILKCVSCDDEVFHKYRY